MFFTRNGKKLDDVVHGLKTQNFFPTVGANGPCTVHVNFGQMGFVFIEANVKKWGLAPMTGSLAPPPPYGSEQGSILLETGRDGGQRDPRENVGPGHSRNRSGFGRMGFPTSPGPVRSPTDISLSQLAHMPSHEDFGEGTSGLDTREVETEADDPSEDEPNPPPDYTSPEGSRRNSDDDGEGVSLLRNDSSQPPIPSYNDAVGNNPSGDAPDEPRGNL